MLLPYNSHKIVDELEKLCQENALRWYERYVRLVQNKQRVYIWHTPFGVLGYSWKAREINY